MSDRNLLIGDPVWKFVPALEGLESAVTPIHGRVASLRTVDGTKVFVYWQTGERKLEIITSLLRADPTAGDEID